MQPGRTLLGVCALISLVDAGSAQAQVQRPLSGKAQFDIAQRFGAIGMPIKPTLPASCLPKGGIDGIKAIAGAKITTTGGIGGSIMVPASQFTLRGPGNPQSPKVRGERAPYSPFLQVYTNFAVRLPNPGWHLRVGSGVAPPGGAKGRTGPDVVSWCVGSTSTVTMGVNPGCTNPSGGAAIKVHSCYSSPNPCPGTGYQNVVVPGFVKYTRTGKMLGGPGSSTASGEFGLALPATGGAVFFPKGSAPPKLAQGMEFGWYHQQNAGKGALHGSEMHNYCGVISKVGPLFNPNALSNRTLASFGGPWTQGMLTVRVATFNGIESYKLTGYDKRTAKGAGKIQLVAGSLGSRSISGGGAGAAIVRLEVPEPPEIAGALIALLVLAGCRWVLRRH